MEFYPLWEEFQLHLVRKYIAEGTTQDEYYLFMGGNNKRIERALKVIGCKRANMNKPIKLWAWGAGGVIDKEKWFLLKVGGIIPTQARDEKEWVEKFKHPKYGYDWHCSAQGRPFANAGFELAVKKAFVSARCNMFVVKIPAVGYLCNVVEWPLENHKGKKGYASLDNNETNNRNNVHAKTRVVAAWLKETLDTEPATFKFDEPMGFEMGVGKAHRRLSSAHHLWQHCCRWSFQPVSPHLLIAMGSHSHSTAVRSLVLAALAALMLSACAPRAAAIRHLHGLLPAASSTAADHSCVRWGCGANAVCVKDRGVASCVCNVGFAMTPTGCADNCALKACGVNGKCIKDSAGVASYTCALKKCGANAKCVKSAAGVASCVCDTGFALQADGVTCTDTCALKKCGVNGKCVKNAAGVASCVCDVGFALQTDASTCTGACSIPHALVRAQSRMHWCVLNLACTGACSIPHALVRAQSRMHWCVLNPACTGACSIPHALMRAQSCMHWCICCPQKSFKGVSCCAVLSPA
ncbi:unnamed protein product [Closterium sp. NIES-65]|nr:unnamed protein product [Closterium sp. NIES-65]